MNEPQPENVASQGAMGRDRFLVWPLLCILAIGIGNILVLVIPGLWLMWVLASVLLGVAIPVAVAVWPLLLFLRGIRARMWRRSASIFILPIGIFLLWASSEQLLRIKRPIAESIQFHLYKHRLDSLMMQRQAQGKGALVVLPLDGFASMANGLAYDATDEILLPRGKQSEGWKSLAVGTELSSDSWSAQRVTGHYYRWAMY